MGFKLRSRTEKGHAPTNDWPGVNDLVWLRLPCCEVAIHPSRVENVLSDALVIAAPSKPHQNPVPPPPEGKTFLLGWRHGVGSKQMRAQIVETAEGSVPTWSVRSVSDTELVQRRRFVRASWDRELTVYLAGSTVTAKILDISEGGLRCSFPAMNEPRNSMFQVSFDLDDSPVLVDVEVAWWGQPNGESVQVGLAFVPKDATLADRLRAHAFSLQLRERQQQHG